MAKPVCPECGRSQGIWAEAGCEVRWSRGAWRFVHIIEGPLSDVSSGCECGASFLLYEAYSDED